jgi:peptidoglycan/xylan/chitin deacetylase (PgdA/CDA1 family)
MWGFRGEAGPRVRRCGRTAFRPGFGAETRHRLIMTLTEVRPSATAPGATRGGTRESDPAARTPGPPGAQQPAGTRNWLGRRIAFAAAGTVLVTASISWATGFGSRPTEPVARSQPVTASVNPPPTTPTPTPSDEPTPQTSGSPVPQPSTTPDTSTAAPQEEPSAPGEGSSPTESPSASAESPTESPSASADPNTAPSPGATPVTTGPPEVNGKKVVYLTFDDGPDPRWTPAVLDALAAHKIRATFFVVGRKVEDHPDLAKRIVAEGHSLQNHTWSHSDLTELPRRDAMEEVARTNEVIKNVTGAAPKCLRPPKGATDSGVQEVAGEAGQASVLWSLDTKDWSNKSTEKITSIVAGGLQPGAIILLHDGGGDRSATVAALPAVLEAIAKAGLSGAPLCA